MAKASSIFLQRSRAQDAKAWFTLREVKFLVRSAMNDAYLKAVNAPGHENDDLHYTDLVAKHLILDWENLDNEDGSKMECTEENKKALLRTYVEIGTRVLTFAGSPVNFIECNGIEEELGN